MEKKMIYPFIKKSRFSTTSALNADSILVRVEALRLRLEAKNTAAKEERIVLDRSQAELKTIEDNLTALGPKSKIEKDSMYTYLKEYGAVMKPNDQITSLKIISDSAKVESLFNKKILEEQNRENSSLLKLINLHSTKEKLAHEAQDKIESMVNKAVEKGISNKELDTSFQGGYFMARALRLKARNEFKEEEKKVYSDSSSRLSPIDYVVETMECAEPDYSDVDE